MKITRNHAQLEALQRIHKKFEASSILKKSTYRNGMGCGLDCKCAFCEKLVQWVIDDVTFSCEDSICSCDRRVKGTMKDVIDRLNTICSNKCDI